MNYRHPLVVHNMRQSIWGPYRRPSRWPRIARTLRLAALGVLALLALASVLARWLLPSL